MSTPAITEVLYSAEVIQERIAALGKQISEEYKGEEVIAVCILRGAFMFAADLLKNFEGKIAIDFMAVSSYGGGTKTSGVVKIVKDLDSDIKGKHVLVIEDIVDTGLTLTYLKEYLERQSPKSLKLCTLLDKPERREVDIAVDYIGFSIPNRFIIGYGLDYDQHYRNLPYIACMD